MANAVGSPFPGMDPWMELRWGDVHNRLATYAADALNSGVPKELYATSEERVYVGQGKDAIRPDVSVMIRPQPAPQSEPESGGGTAILAEPAFDAEAYDYILRPQQITEPFIEIRDRQGNRVITVIEFVSPSNKVDTAARELYREKRQDLYGSETSLVEIDLTRAGGWEARQKLWHPVPLAPPADATYAYRATRRHHATVYPMPLRRRLPTLPVPLRPDDADVPLDLQAIIEQIYRNGRYEITDYADSLFPPLSADDAAFAQQRLAARAVG